MEARDGLSKTIAELVELIRDYTPQRKADVEAYLEHVGLQLAAKKQISEVLDEEQAIRLDLLSREVLMRLSGGEFSDEDARNFFRLRLAAQVLREGFSQRVNQAFAALFSKAAARRPAVRFRTNLGELGDDHENEEREREAEAGENPQGSG